MEYLAGVLIGIILAAAAAASVFRGRLLACAQARSALEREQAVLAERLESKDTLIGRLEAELREARAALEGASARNAGLQAAAAGVGAELRVLEEARETLGQAFTAMSAQALRTNNEAFLQLATQALGKYQKGAEGELEKRQQAIGELVAPVKQTLEKLDGRIQEIEKTREGAYQALTTQLSSLRATQDELRRETGNLVKALRQPQARGRWGELQLRRVVEMAGMLEYCDFVEQKSVQAEDSRLRPDLIVRLPGGKNIVVDAKTPLSAYLEALETDDDGVRQQKLVEHSRQVRDHMAKLGRKSYQEQFEPTPDLVVLFLPGEMFFSAALQHDPELIEFGVGEKVIPATPTTLIALLRAVAYGWKQEALARNAQQISELGRELYERLGTMAVHWRGVGKNLGDAVSAYNKAVGSMETRVLVSARKFKELTVGDREIEEVGVVDVVPRVLMAAEMNKELAGVS
jgi:DNA recombination protein RmuC